MTHSLQWTRPDDITSENVRMAEYLGSDATRLIPIRLQEGGFSSSLEFLYNYVLAAFVLEFGNGLDGSQTVCLPLLHCIAFNVATVICLQPRTLRCDHETRMH
jgi:hypothetical protein